jgi:hypothetical protein
MFLTQFEMMINFDIFSKDSNQQKQLQRLYYFQTLMRGAQRLFLLVSFRQQMKNYLFYYFKA